MLHETELPSSFAVDKIGKSVLNNVVHRLTNSVLLSILSILWSRNNDMKIYNIDIRQNLWKGSWDTWKIEFIALYRLGIMMDKYCDMWAISRKWMGKYITTRDWFLENNWLWNTFSMDMKTESCKRLETKPLLPWFLKQCIHEGKGSSFMNSV
jgi:hypothetical protein